MPSSPTRTLLAALLASAVSVTAGTARADSTAADHFARGVALFNDGSLDGALVEFQEAYDLSHNFRILFNIALCHANANDPAAAIDAYERYLKEGGNAVPERAEVAAAEIARLRKVVEEVTITADAPPDAVLWIDGKRVGEFRALTPRRLKLGRHELRVTSGAQSALFDENVVAGRTAIALRMPKQAVVAPPPAPLRVAHRASPPWALWAASGGLAAAAACTGAFAWSARNAGLRSAATYGAPRADAEQAHARAVRWAVATNALAVAALGTTLVASYLTVARRTIQVSVTPTGAAVGGSF